MNCIVCLKGGQLCQKPGIDNLKKLKEYATNRTKFGESKLAPLCERMNKLSADEYILSRYHSSCYKEIVHIQKLQRSQKRFHESSPMPAKKGRPSTSSSEMADDSKNSKSTRNIEHVKEKRCIFQCKTPNKGELFFVSTKNMGQTFLFIKENTENNNIRAALSMINEPLDCHALDIAYHRDCLRHEKRTCQRKIKKKEVSNSSAYLIADIDIVNIVKCSLSSGSIITMNEVNENYNTLLSEYGIIRANGIHKKHLKQLISTHIPEAEFVMPHRVYESEQIVSKQLLSEKVTNLRETSNSEEVDIECLAKAAAILRRVISCSVNWNFSGSMTDYEPPLKLSSFIKWVIAGTKDRKLTEDRSSELHRLSSLLAMLFINNFQTDRQVTYQPKSEFGFQNRIETPLSVGLSLAVHKKTRSKEMINIISQLKIGSSYDYTVQLEKRIATAVSERVSKTGGFFIPPFIKEGDNVTFAIDNIDFQENTPDGQRTLHGTLLVISQEENDDKVAMNDPLVIPPKPSLSNMQVLYKTVPNISVKTITFTNFRLDSDNDIIKNYKVSDLAWFFCCYAHRDGTMEASTSNTSVSIVSKLNKVREKIALKKAIMPTWASSNSVLLEMQEKGKKNKKTNSAVVAPLMRLPPTDINALYTVICMAEEIATLVQGEAAKVIMTMDMDLYERALKIQLSTGNQKWLFRVGELHVCFASLHALGKYIDGSGLDLICTETGLYSPAIFRQIFGGKKYTRGIEFHMTIVLACYDLLFETLPHSTEIISLQEKCNLLREKLHNCEVEAISLFEEIKAVVGKNCLPHITQCSGDMAKFLLQYMNQFGSLLRFIRASRQGDWALHLASLEEQIKYYFAHDLFHYARHIPVYIAQMKDLKTTHPDVWNALESGCFAISKSNVPFTKLFSDQNLEQKIKELKNIGGITGLTQNESALERYFLCAQEILRIVSSFFEKYCPNEICKQPMKHYQLQTSMSLRIFHNAAIIKESIRNHCGGNPFRDNTTLMNIASSMKVPESAKDDILNCKRPIGIRKICKR